MKFFIAALGFCAIAAVSAVPAVVNTGHSAQFRSQDSLGNYAFGYNEDHATGGTFRRESGSPGVAEGSYGLRVADGRVRVVNYVADALGFRANIQTNEPGVEDQDPASVLINKAAAIVAPYIKSPVVAAAPLAIQQSIEAPIVQKYEAGPIIDAAPIVQKYEQAPIIEQAPIVQQYESAPIVQKYEQAPLISAAAPAYAAQAYASPAAYAPAAYGPAPIVQKYEQAPIIEQAPIVQQYEQAPIAVAAPAPLVSSYTTKTYAAPAPILSAPAVAAAPISAAYGPGPIGVSSYGPAPIAQYAEPTGAYLGAASYATKTAAPVGISSAALGLARPISPVFAAKTLGAYGGLPLIKKK